MHIVLLKIRNSIYLLQMRWHIVRLSVLSAYTKNIPFIKKFGPAISIVLILLCSSFFLLGTPQLIKKTLKQQFGIGGPPIYRAQLYTIKEKESLWQIAKKKNLAFDTLVTVNKLKNIHALHAGQTIYIPNQDGVLYTLRAGESLFTVTEKFKVNLEDTIDVNDLALSCTNQVFTNRDIFVPGGRLTPDERIGIMGLDFFRPTGAHIRSAFGYRTDPFTKHKQYHTGIDFGCGTGTIVKAAADGQVVYAGDHGGYGIAVILRHHGGYTTVYGHLSKTLVLNGQFVKAGQQIALSGSTGRSTGPHLHFEVRRYGIPVNPLNVMYFFAKR